MSRCVYMYIGLWWKGRFLQRYILAVAAQRKIAQYKKACVHIHSLYSTYHALFVLLLRNFAKNDIKEQHTWGWKLSLCETLTGSGSIKLEHTYTSAYSQLRIRHGMNKQTTIRTDGCRSRKQKCCKLFKKDKMNSCYYWRDDTLHHWISYFVLKVLACFINKKRHSIPHKVI